MKFSTPVKFLLLVLLVVIGWNYWLHTAWDMFEKVTQMDKGDLHNVDFLAYYNAGARFLHNDNPYFWRPDAQNNPVISDYIYPPPVLPLFGLLSRLPYDLARLVWLIAYGLSYLAILGWMACSFAPEGRDAFLAISLGFTLASFPLLSHIQHGQVDIFIISLILASYLAYIRKNHLLAAILLAVATLIKVSPGFLLIYYVVFRRDFRFLLMYMGSLAILMVSSLLFIPLGWYLDYVRYVLPEIGKGDAFWLSQSITKYLSFSPNLSRATGIAGLGLLAILVWLISRRYSAEEHKPALPLGNSGSISELVFILNLSGTLVFLGKAWVAAYVWLIIPSAWLAIILLTRQVKLPWLVGFGAGIALILAKVYGFPILESMNLWGGLIITACLATGLLTKKFQPPHHLSDSETPLKPR
jgi:hypothetical protein